MILYSNNKRLKMNKYRIIKLLCFIVILVVSITAKSQIVKNDLKIYKETVIFVDTITIEQPIIIKHSFKSSCGGIYFWRKCNNMVFYFSSKAYLDRITDKNFSNDSLLFSDICYNYLYLVSRFPSKDLIKEDVFLPKIYDMFTNDLSSLQRGRNYMIRDYIKTNKKGISYSEIKTKRFAIFLVRDDFFSKSNPDITKYNKVAIPIESLP